MSGDALISTNNRMEQLSVAYVHAVASYCGFGADIPKVDHDSVDITITSSSGKKAKLDIQLKSTTKINICGDNFSYSLPIKNYNDFRKEALSPRILVILCMPDIQENWLKHSSEELAIRKCAYWVSLMGQPETNNKSSVTINVSVKNMFSPEVLKELMDKADRREDL